MTALTYRISNGYEIFIGTFHKALLKVRNHLQKHRKNAMLAPLSEIYNKE
jgi:hypothetical protein